MFGIPEIDQQHRELIKMFRRLNDAVKNNEPREDIYRLIDHVISFTTLHFAAEEELMAQSGYQEIETHKNNHRQQMQELHHFRKKLDLTGEQVFVEWFNHWPFANLLAHIQYGDHQVRNHIKQGGIKE